MRCAGGIVLNDKEEFNHCELQKMSVSKQRQKPAISTRDREINKDIEKEEEMRHETQFKRRGGENDETETEIRDRELGEKKREPRRKAKRRRRTEEKENPEGEDETEKGKEDSKERKETDRTV